ncbi:hypothetical protein [Dongshaea marina]|uniref:hypothetical protein n=1 Tax=Dongshaea marina TaxID=2047966 RepID=UPI000D3E8140|nr:hypothetical protein [Dongshaea marina]
MDGAWALVMLYDYHHGKDFIRERFKPRMYPITRDNLAQYQPLLIQSRWEEIDFRKFSKVYNPKVKRYDFSPEMVMKSLRKK